MIVGLTAEQLGRVTLIGAILASVLLAVLLPVGCFPSTVRSFADVVWCVFLSVACGAILPVIVGVGGMLRLRIEPDDIPQLFCSGLLRADLRRNSGALRSRSVCFQYDRGFAGGSQFRPLVLHVGFRAALAASTRATLPGVKIK